MQAKLQKSELHAAGWAPKHALHCQQRTRPPAQALLAPDIMHNPHGLCAVAISNPFVQLPCITVAMP